MLRFAMPAPIQYGDSLVAAFGSAETLVIVGAVVIDVPAQDRRQDLGKLRPLETTVLAAGVVGEPIPRTDFPGD